MRMRSNAVVALFLALLGSPAVLGAQGVRLGPMVGLNSATLGGDDAEGVDSRISWLLGGFVNFDINPAFGMASPIGTASDLLTRNAPGAPPGTTLRIRFPNTVEVGQADLLDQLIDASSGNVTCIVQWVLPALDGLVTLDYFVTVYATC